MFLIWIQIMVKSGQNLYFLLKLNIQDREHLVILLLYVKKKKKKLHFIPLHSNLKEKFCIFNPKITQNNHLSCCN